MRIIDWLQQPQWQKRAVRYADPGIVACYWEGTGATAHKVQDVSLPGRQAWS